MGPLLFQNSTARLSGDDCLLYRTIYKVNDKIYQADLDILKKMGEHLVDKVHSRKNMLQINRTPVTPIIEYACVLWDPYGRTPENWR